MSSRPVLQKRNGVADNDELLIYGNDVGMQLGIVSGDAAFATNRCHIAVTIELKATPFHASQDTGAYFGRIFTDTATEYNGVSSVKDSEVRADVLLYPVAEHVYGQGSHLISLTLCIQ
jgi:hypothetical protein